MPGSICTGYQDLLMSPTVTTALWLKRTKMSSHRRRERCGGGNVAVQVVWNDKTARVELMVHGPMDVLRDVICVWERVKTSWCLNLCI